MNTIDNSCSPATGNSRWIVYDSATGCTTSAAPAIAQNLQPNGWDLALNFGACASASVKTLTLAWVELKLDGTPKECRFHQEGDIQDQDDENERQEFTNAGVARHHCGIIHIDPALGTALLQKLKYGKGYSFILTAHADLGLYGTKDFVTASFIVKLAKNSSATSLSYTNTLAPQPPPPSTIGAPGPGGRLVNYYQKDHLGTIRVVSDEAGNVLSTHDYEPFGLELPGQDPSDNTHRFTGHERDTETGLDYMKARYYGAGMGRFARPDSMLDSSPQEIQSWNRYKYVYNNPIHGIDPDGKLQRNPDGSFRYEAVAVLIGEAAMQQTKGAPMIADAFVVGHLFANNGTPIEALQMRAANGSNALRADCHGVTFAAGNFWIDNSQVRNLLKGDGYTNVSAESKQLGDVLILTGNYVDKNGKPVGDTAVQHSVTVTGVDASGYPTAFSGLGGLQMRSTTSSLAPTVNPFSGIQDNSGNTLQITGLEYWRPPAENAVNSWFGTGNDYLSRIMNYDKNVSPDTQNLDMTPVTGR